MKSICFGRWQVYLLILFLFFLFSCSDKEDKVIELSAQTNPDVSAIASSQFLAIQSNNDWKIEVTYISGGIAWITINPTSGQGDANVILQFTQNSAKENRVAELTVTSGDKEVVLPLIQKAGSTSVEVRKPDPNWLEIPSGGGNSDCVTLTHDITVRSQIVRSYSMMFDKKEKIAYWVAYPHNPCYIGNSGRTDLWSVDPGVASADQPEYLSSIFGYDRGHQIPSADRTVSTLANNQTFYFTNITPQMGGLNQYMWENLEEQVRNWMSASDTLYVVTGAILKTVGGNETVKYATDNKGAKVAVPNYYYKVLLRLKTGKYDAIGFWVEHRSYGDIPVNASVTKSVDQIEALTGFDFFASLTKSVQDVAEATCVPANWGL
jgi:endonuclease G